MIKAVLFDYGGVMSTGGKGSELTNKLKVNLGVSDQRALEILNSSWDEYASGRISEEELWQRMEKVHGAPIPADKRRIWNPWNVMKPLPEMVAFVKSLKQQGLIVGLLSNVIPYTVRQIRENGGYDIFDFTVLSAEVGFGKPQPEIYQIALDRLPSVQPSEVIFIDDQERFIVPAQILGIHTVIAVSTEQIITDTMELIESL